MVLRQDILVKRSHLPTSRVVGNRKLSTALENLFAQKFIARQDAKAQQSKDGKWYVDTTTGKADGQRLPWDREALRAHIAGERTYGHYLLGTDSQCKLFSFDIDLEKSGSLPSVPFSECEIDTFYEEPDLRSAWLNRAHPAREFMKWQFKRMAHMLTAAIIENLGISCAVAYSGNKGVHVYGFTGNIPAAEAREGAQIVLDSIGEFHLIRGEHFFRHNNKDVFDGFPNLSIEVFPKQTTLMGKDLGNLMRLPLGKNLKAPNEPTFFIDMRSPISQMVPRDPVEAMSTDNPFS